MEGTGTGSEDCWVGGKRVDLAHLVGDWRPSGTKHGGCPTNAAVVFKIIKLLYGLDPTGRGI